MENKTSAERAREARAKAREFMEDLVYSNEDRYSFPVPEDVTAQLRAWYKNPDDDGIWGKRTECAVRFSTDGETVERVHGAGKTDVSLPWMHKGVECKTGVFECSIHYETKEQADAVRETFLAGGKLFKTRGYIFYMPIGSDTDLGGGRIQTVAHAEAWLRAHPKAVITKQSTGGTYWTVSIQNYRASLKSCKEFLNGFYGEGKPWSEWLTEHGV